MLAEQEEIAESRKVWMETKDARKALDRMGRRHGIERHLLTGLSKRGIQDPLGSLSMVSFIQISLLLLEYVMALL